MRRNVDQIESIVTEAAPHMERELGALEGLKSLPPELRLRVYGPCSIVSETLRCRFESDGMESRLRVRKLPKPLEGQHVLLIARTEEGLAVVDATYSQLFEAYGPSYTAARDGRPIRFPESRSLVFLDGQQDMVAEWATEVATMANPGVDRETAYAFFRNMWDLREYYPHTAWSHTQKYAERLGRELWPTAAAIGETSE